ncbi:MAG TPA: polynucleotide adenylyltransferase PcnB [Planctomycetota bacterium]|nr:polynucleotide adenylyltransferase PcnB [Planctomycetota bacterium]
MDSPLTHPQRTPESEPRVLSRAEHPISRRDIDKDALRVLNRLASSGHLAYLVGGGVRDLVLGKKPKDFDVATDARPSRLKKVFRNCRIIGRRFRIAHVYFPGGKIIEVSTFRRGSHTTVKTDKGMILSDNEYGTPREDALRRDLTINGLFYDIASFSLIDYVGGVQDLKDRIVRTIADPDSSFREDPVRMIRVERHAARTGFEIEGKTLEAIYRNREEIRLSNPARLLEEVLKDLKGGAAAPFFQLMAETRLFDCLLPALAAQLREYGSEHPLWRRMKALDRLVEGGATYTSPLLLGIFLHTMLFSEPELWTGARNNPADVWHHIGPSWRDISKTIRISRRDTERMAQILISYRKLIQSCERQRLLPALHRKPYLSEALDFLEIDLTSLDRPTDFIKEWRRFAPAPAQPEPRYRFLKTDMDDAALGGDDLLDSPAARDPREEGFSGIEGDLALEDEGHDEEGLDAGPFEEGVHPGVKGRTTWGANGGAANLGGANHGAPGRSGAAGQGGARPEDGESSERRRRRRGGRRRNRNRKKD